MDVTARSPKDRPALDQAIGRLRHCEDALLRHLARQIERDELSPVTAFAMLERFEMASLAQLTAAGLKGNGVDVASDAAVGALRQRIEILGATLRGIEVTSPTLVSTRVADLPRESDYRARPRSSRHAG